MSQYTLHDSYGILPPEVPCFDRFPLMKLCSYSYSLSRFNNSQVQARILRVFEDGAEHSYLDVWRKLFSAKGKNHDIDTMKSLMYMRLAIVSSTGKYGRKFYQITDLGKEVLRAADVNQKCNKVLRWFKDTGVPLEVRLITADLEGKDSWIDFEPSAFIEMLEEIFDPRSDMHDIGTCFMWLNKLVRCLSNDSSFFEKFNCQEVNDWLAGNTQLPGIEVFRAKLARTAKKFAKLAA